MRTLPLRCSLAVTLAFAAGCGTSGVPERRPPAPVADSSGDNAAVAGAGRIRAPVTYGNRLPWPCADCPSLQLTLTLFPDSTFRLRRIYQDRPVVFHYLGRWSVAENDTRLVLRGGSDSPQLFEIVGADSLRLLDASGRPFQSELSYTLVRAPQLDPVRDTMRLRGMYMYMADAGRFTECRSHATFPVAHAGANAALERAYVEARAEPGAPVLIRIRGHFEERPAMEGDRRIEYVVVDSVVRIERGSCEEPARRGSPPTRSSSRATRGSRHDSLLSTSDSDLAAASPSSTRYMRCARRSS